MANDPKTVRALYKKLLGLYPRGFREQVGESMEQTFNDLCNERKQRRDRLLPFALLIFVETAIGISKEHLLLIKEGVAMKTVTTTLGSAALISSILVLPFLILEWINHRNLHGRFPVALFAFMWLLPVAFLVIVLPLVRTIRAGNPITAKPISFLFKVAFLITIAMLWTANVIDQLPCFLGVPNCD